MPQIEQLADTYASQIFWLLLTFGLVFFTVGLGMLPKVQKTVDARDKSVADDLAAAEAARAAADAAEEDWRIRENAARAAAQEQVAKARAKAAAAAEKTLAKGSAKDEAKLAEAEARIAAQRTAALGEIEAAAVDVVQDLLPRVAGTSVSAADAQRAVKAALNG